MFSVGLLPNFVGILANKNSSIFLVMFCFSNINILRKIGNEKKNREPCSSKQRYITSHKKSDQVVDNDWIIPL